MTCARHDFGTPSLQKKNGQGPFILPLSLKGRAYLHCISREEQFRYLLLLPMFCDNPGFTDICRGIRAQAPAFNPTPAVLSFSTASSSSSSWPVPMTLFPTCLRHEAALIAANPGGTNPQQSELPEFTTATPPGFESTPNS